jgi:hypothetical protein
MGFFDRLFRRKSDSTLSANPNEQAVLIHLDGQSLPDEIYEQYDLETLEDQLTGIMNANSLGKFDGNEFGPEETVLFIYGPDAERLFAGIESAIRAYPLCRGARVVIRKGPPGAPEREMRMPPT